MSKGKAEAMWSQMAPMKVRRPGPPENIFLLIFEAFLQHKSLWFLCNLAKNFFTKDTYAPTWQTEDTYWYSYSHREFCCFENQGGRSAFKTNKQTNKQTNKTPPPPPTTKKPSSLTLFHLYEKKIKKSIDILCFTPLQMWETDKKCVFITKIDLSLAETLWLPQYKLLDTAAYNCHRINKYPSVKGTHKDHWVQLPAALSNIQHSNPMSEITVHAFLELQQLE